MERVSIRRLARTILSDNRTVARIYSALVLKRLGTIHYILLIPKSQCKEGFVAVIVIPNICDIVRFGVSNELRGA